MYDKIILRKSPKMVTRVIEDETILLPIYKTSEEINCIYTLNKTASRVWELIDGKTQVDGIKKKILKEFNTTPQEVNNKMEMLVRELREMKAIQ